MSWTLGHTYTYLTPPYKNDNWPASEFIAVGESVGDPIELFYVPPISTMATNIDDSPVRLYFRFMCDTNHLQEDEDYFTFTFTVDKPLGLLHGTISWTSGGPLYKSFLNTIPYEVRGWTKFKCSTITDDPDYRNAVIDQDPGFIESRSKLPLPLRRRYWFILASVPAHNLNASSRLLEMFFPKLLPVKEPSFF